MDPLRRLTALCKQAAPDLQLPAPIESLLDYSAPTLGGVALWLFTVTGWPLFVQAFRTSEKDYEVEVA